MQQERPIAADARPRSSCRIRDACRYRAAARSAPSPFHGRCPRASSPSAARSAWLPCRRRAGYRVRSGRERSVISSPVIGSVPRPSGSLSAAIRIRAAFGRELAGEVAFRIVRAADEGAVLAELQRQVAGAADLADARIAAVLALREDQRRQRLVQRIQHVGDAQFLGVFDLGEEILPEIAQHLLPVRSRRRKSGRASLRDRP
jgi:hypothetical protein